MNLILAGGGSGEQTVRVNTLFSSLVKNNDMFFIPTARSYKQKDEESLKWVKGELGRYSDFNITLCTEEDLKNITYDELLKYGGIFIGGGNAFYLLKQLRDTQFDTKLVKLLENTDIPVMGGSAGALIFGKSIKTAEPYDENFVNLRNLNGFNMINGKNIWVHYEDSREQLVRKYVDILKTEIICLREKDGLYIKDKGEVEDIGEVRVIGT
jgi:dipeptidase E